jgi:FkbM family methyltransferase
LPLNIRKTYPKTDIIYKKITKKKLFNLNFNNLIICSDNIYYSIIDYESLYIITPGFESWVNNYLRIKKGDVFIDVGSHIGKYTFKAADIIGNNGLVIAIEPTPENYRHLVRGIKLNDFRNVITLNIAAWYEECDLKIYYGETAGLHTSKFNASLGFFIAKAKTIDNIIKKLNIKKVDWIKIDVEGASFEVLKGSIEVINRFKPKIIIEILPENFEKISCLLGMNDYFMTQISPFYYIAENLKKIII